MHPMRMKFSDACPILIAINAMHCNDCNALVTEKCSVNIGALYNAMCSLPNVQCVLRCSLCIVHGELHYNCTLCTVHYPLHWSLYPVYNVHYTGYCTVCTVHFPVFTVHCALSTTLVTVYNVHCTGHCTLCTMYTALVTGKEEEVGVRSRPLAAPLSPDPSCLSRKPLVGRRDQKYIYLHTNEYLPGKLRNFSK